MANIQIIDIGAKPNDRTGDSLRTAFDKTNDNFAAINAQIGNLSVNITDAVNIGVTGANVFAGVNNNVAEFRRIVAGEGITITEFGNEIGIVNSQSIQLEGTAGSIVTIDGSGGLTVSSVLLLDAESDQVSTIRSLKMTQNKIVDLANPTDPQDAATKAYVDSQITGAGSTVTVLENNNEISTVRQLNFVGDGVEIVETLPGKVDISITSGVNVDAVQGVVGTMFTDNLDEGILTEYSADSGKVNVTVKDFDIVLDGAITGSATVSNFNNNIIIQTTADFLRGLTISKDGIDIGTRNSVNGINFAGDNISVSRTDGVVTVEVDEGLTGSDVRDQIGSTVKGVVSDPLDPSIETESGITTVYRPENNTLELGVREFDITLSGAVTGSGTVSRLQDVNIITTSEAINGLTVSKDAVRLGSPNSVKSVDFLGDNISILRSGNSISVAVDSGLSTADVRDEIGSTVKGVVADPTNPEVETESGITVVYRPENNTLELGVREFDIALTGAVTGSATVSRLNDVTINTDTNLIEGLTVSDDSLQLGDPNSVKSIDFVGDKLLVSRTGNSVSVEVAEGLSAADVRDEIGSTVKGVVADPTNPEVETESGITVVYRPENNTLELGVREFDIALSGAVTGSATVSRLNDVTINTATNLIEGLTVSDDSLQLGEANSVKSIDFVGDRLLVSRTGNSVSVEVAEGLSTADVRDEIGSTVKGVVADPTNPSVETESGITAVYRPENNTLELGVREFDIALSGAVTGSATVSRLQDVTINTTTDLIEGLTVSDDSLQVGEANSVKGIDFVGDRLLVSRAGNIVSVEVAEGLSPTDVRDEIGSTVKGVVADPTNPEVETESGITVVYRPENNTLELGVKDFDIALSGAVTGSATVSRLNDVTINTTTDLIEGLTVGKDSLQIGSSNSVKNIDFLGENVLVSRAGNTISVSVDPGLSLVDVRDEIGTTVKGVSSDPTNPAAETETGITTNYVAENNTLELGVRDFNIALSGAVTGNATISRLQDVTINTTTDAIEGLTVSKDSLRIGNPDSVTSFNFVGNNLLLNRVGDTIEFQVLEGLSTVDVRDEIGSTVKGVISDPENPAIETESGITANYVAENNTLELGVRDFNIALAGAVTGNATVSRLQDVTILTSTDLIEGLTVSDDSLQLGDANSVKSIDFVGNNLLVARSGNAVTVSVSEGLSTSDVRDVIGSTVKGLVPDVNNPNVEVESGITTNYIAENNTLELGVRDFDIALTGAVTGSATVSRLQNITISTTTDAIEGVTVSKDSLQIGDAETVKGFNFLGDNFTVTRTDDVVSVVVDPGLTNSDVRDVIGTTVKGIVSDPVNPRIKLNSGITTSYVPADNTLELGVRDFNITLSGAVSGSATVSRLQDITLVTTSDAIEGITVRKDSLQLGDADSVDALNFVGSNMLVSRSGNSVSISVSEGLSNNDVQDIIGTTVKGVVADPTNPAVETESGITTNYVAENNTLEIGVREFDIALSGAVTGSATVSRLNDVTINTTTNLIEGLTVSKDQLQLGASNSVKNIDFVGNNLLVSRDGNVITVEVDEGLVSSDVRDIIGTTVKGVTSDPENPAIETESGITTNYVAENNTLEIGTRDFDITLTGAVNGTGTVSRLQDLVINTTSDAIEGLTLRKDGSQVGQAETIDTFNFIGDNIVAVRSGNTAQISVESTITGDQVSDVLNPRLLGQQDGLSITYDSLNKIYNYQVNPISINLTGAVTGNGTITFDGSAVDGAVTINTIGGDGGSGVTIADEGETEGQVSQINFVGGGITTAVSLDGQVATVFVPNSPAAEPFITAEPGSENIPNARRLVAGSGVLINDTGAGGNIIISANNDSIVAKNSYSIDGELVAEQFGININTSQYIVPFLENDTANSRVNLNIYTLKDAWYRQPVYDAGSIADNQGPILDFGTIGSGILETTPDLGEL